MSENSMPLDPEQGGAPTDEELAEVTRGSTPGSSGPAGAAGGMGVSSERVGHAGPGQEATDGLREVAPHETSYGGEGAPPEQSRGGHEPKPTGLPPKAGYSERDPREDDEVWQFDESEASSGQPGSRGPAGTD